MLSQVFTEEAAEPGWPPGRALWSGGKWGASRLRLLRGARPPTMSSPTQMVRAHTQRAPQHTHTHIQRPLGTPPRTTGLRAVDVNTLLPATVPSCSGGLEGEQHLHVTNSGVPRAQHRPSTSHRNDGMRAALGRGGQHTGAGGSAHGMAQVQNNVS